VVSERIFLSQTTGPNALIFSMKHPLDKEIKGDANEVPGVINGPAPYRFIYKYIANSLENLLMNHCQNSV